MKGQVGLETLFVFGMLIVFFVFAFLSFLQRSTDVDFASKFLAARKVCDTVSGTIDFVHTSGFGSAMNFTIPPSLEGRSYNVTVNSFGQSVAVRWDKYTESCPIVTRNVTNSTHNTFVLNDTTKVARNNNGVVVL